jgi:hypothetical protein
MHNKNEIFGVSLNELAFLLFFLIVLLSALKINNDKEIIDDKTEQNTFLEQQLELTKTELDKAVSELKLVKDKFSELFSSGKKLDKDYLDEQITKLVTLEEKNRSLETELTKTKEQLEKEQESANLLEEIKQTLNENGVEDPQALIDAYKKEVAKNKTLMGQYKNIERRLAGNGLDHPPCWADSESGKPEYMFTVRIMPEMYILERAWPAHRNEEMHEIAKGINDKLPREFTHQEFSKLAYPIFQQSKKQKPECRHFVMVEDSTLTSKEQYKNGLSRVENYFYKLIVR